MAWTSRQAERSRRRGLPLVRYPPPGGAALPDVPAGGFGPAAHRVPARSASRQMANPYLQPAAMPLAAGAPGPGGAAAPVTGGESTLPRMIGRPSLPVPMTTIFEFGDCASCSVASMPRQRR